MNEFANFREQMPGILRSLAVGIPAGFLFDHWHAPIPWMIWPMVAVAALNLTGVGMHSPPYARQMGQVILGSAVSLYFTPPVVAALAGNVPPILAATVSVFLVGILGALTLSKASGVDAKSTFFASIPGGAMAMAVLADRYGAQIRAGCGRAQLARLRRRYPDSVSVDLRRLAARSIGLPTGRAVHPFSTSRMAGDRVAVGRDLREIPFSQRLSARTDFSWRRAHHERRPAFGGAPRVHGFRSADVRPSSRRAL